MPKENGPVHYRVDPARTAYLKFYVLGILILIVGIYYHLYFGNFIILISSLLVLILISAIVEFVRRFGLTLFIKEDGITKEEGFFSKTYVEIDYEQIVRTIVSQKFVDRILRKGTLEIDTTGMAKSELDFKNIPNPMKYKKIIDDFIEKKRHEMHLLRSGSAQPKTSPPENRGDSY